MKGDLLLTFNTGSSTVKLGLFEMRAGRPVRVARGTIDFRTDPLTFRLAEGGEERAVPLKARGEEALPEILTETFDLLGADFDLTRLKAAGHRVVHGGVEHLRLGRGRLRTLESAGCRQTLPQVADDSPSEADPGLEAGAWFGHGPPSTGTEADVGHVSWRRVALSER